jgi:hypothetical protein
MVHTSQEACGKVETRRALNRCPPTFTPSPAPHPPPTSVDITVERHLKIEQLRFKADKLVRSDTTRMPTFIAPFLCVTRCRRANTTSPYYLQRFLSCDLRCAAFEPTPYAPPPTILNVEVRGGGQYNRGGTS